MWLGVASSCGVVFGASTEKAGRSWQQGFAYSPGDRALSMGRDRDECAA